VAAFSRNAAATVSHWVLDLERHLDRVMRATCFEFQNDNDDSQKLQRDPRPNDQENKRAAQPE
jgi:hypothetical protein